jgi:hypothetical protein
VVVEKRHDVIQGGLRSLSIHGSRIYSNSLLISLLSGNLKAATDTG